MQITDIRVRKLFDNERPLKAVVSVTFDGQLAVHDIKVIYAGGRYMVVMPGKKAMDGSFRDIAHPINQEFRAELESGVMDAYDKALGEQAAAPAGESFSLDD